MIDWGKGYSSKGFERQAGNAVLALVAALLPDRCRIDVEVKPPPEMPGYMSGTSGTPNQRGLLRCWAYLWTQFSGQGDLDVASFHLSEHFIAQFTTRGQQYAEFLSTSHGHLHRLIAAAARLGALKYNDPIILDLTGKWWRRELWLYDQLAASDGHVYSPGARSAGPVDEQRSVIYALLRGRAAPGRYGDPSRPIAGRPNDPDGPFWQSVYNSPAWLVRELIFKGDDLGGSARMSAADGIFRTPEPAVLQDPLHIWRKGDNFVLAFPRISRATKPCWWVARIGGKVTTSPEGGSYRKPTECPYPWPTLEGSTETVIPGVDGKEPRRKK